MRRGKFPRCGARQGKCRSHRRQLSGPKFFGNSGCFRSAAPRARRRTCFRRSTSTMSKRTVTAFAQAAQVSLRGRRTTRFSRRPPRNSRARAAGRARLHLDETSARRRGPRGRVRRAGHAGCASCAEESRSALARDQAAASWFATAARLDRGGGAGRKIRQSQLNMEFAHPRAKVTCCHAGSHAGPFARWQIQILGPISPPPRPSWHPPTSRTPAPFAAHQGHFQAPPDKEDVHSVIELTASKVVEALQAQSMTFYMVEGTRSRSAGYYSAHAVGADKAKEEKIQDRAKLLALENSHRQGIVGKVIETASDLFSQPATARRRSWPSMAQTTGFAGALDAHRRAQTTSHARRDPGAQQGNGRRHRRRVHREDLALLKEVAEYPRRSSTAWSIRSFCRTRGHRGSLETHDLPSSRSRRKSNRRQAHRVAAMR